MSELIRGQLFRYHSMVRLFGLVITMIVVFIRPGFEGQVKSLAVWAGVLAILWSTGGVELRRAKQGLMVLLVVSFLLTLSQALLLDSDSANYIFLRLFGDYGVSLSHRGIVAGLVGSLKVAVVLMAGQWAVSGLDLEEMSNSLFKLGLSFRASNMLTMSMRFVPLVSAKWSEIIAARRLRGIDEHSMSLVRRLFVFYPSLLVPLILGLFRLGLDLEIALFTRGFYVIGPKTPLRDYSMHLHDFCAIVFMVLGASMSLASL